MSPSPSRPSKSSTKSKAAKSSAKPKPAAKSAVARSKVAAKPASKAPAKPAKKVGKVAAKAATTKPAARKSAPTKAATKPAAKKVAKKVARKPLAKPASKAVTKSAAPKKPAPVAKAPPVPAPAAPRLEPVAPAAATVVSAPAPAPAPAPSASMPPRSPQGQPPFPPRPDQRPDQRPQQQQNRPYIQQPQGNQQPQNRHGDQRPPQNQQQQPPRGQQPQDRGPRQGQPNQPYPQRFDHRGPQGPRPQPDQRGGGDWNRGGGGGGGGGNRPPQQQQQQRPPQQPQRAPTAIAEPPDRQPAVRAPEPAAAPAPVKHPIAPAGPTHPGRDEIFERGVKFADLGLRESVLKGITEAGFEFPTAIQARIIPVILSGKDVLGQAKTGTGKTAAFGLPLLHRTEQGQPFQALVLVPTRELAIQVATDLRELGRYTPLHILPVYGGQNVKTQAQLLSRGPEIIVATPGRVMDMVQRGYINYRSIKTVVLDEVDRMLDIGFRDDIRRILSGCPKDRQTVFVSATIHSEIESLARSFCNQCEKIIASAGSLTVSMVKQWHLPVAPWDKKQLLLHLLTHEDPALTLVFCRTKKTVDNIAEYLQRKGVDCHAIHGDMYQNKRNKVIEQLKAGKLEVLIASDVASRGLDVEGITHVINYDLPEDPDLYVHRIGRTARAGRDGVAWSLVTPEQGEMLTQIELLINAEIPKLDYPDFKPGPVPSDVLHRQQSDQRRVDTARQFNRFSSVPAPGGAGASSSGGNAPAASPASAPSGAPAPAPARIAAPAPQPDLNRFPGGIVPTMAPPKRMFGRVKSARSMRAAIQQTAAVPPAPAGAQPQADAAPVAPAQSSHAD